jgi:LacI family transcriptional regulator
MLLNTTETRITIVDVAGRAGVSPGTVSRVLNNVPNVDDELKQRVLTAVKSLGYIHIPKRRNLVNQQAHTPNVDLLNLSSIVMCVREMETPAPRNVYYSQVLHGAQTECARRSVNMVYCSLKDSANSITEIQAIVQRGQAAGILLVGLNNRTLVEKVIQLNLPVVLINTHYPSLAADTVVCDFYEGTKLAIGHLTELGHRNIVFVMGPNDDYSVQRRIEGYRIGLIKAGLPYRAELIFQSNLTISGGEEVAHQILQSNLKYSAICCANDGTAIGVIRTLSTAGVRVPEDVSVIGFDNLDVAALISPPLTTIHTNIEALGTLAIDHLIERVLPPDRLYRHTLVGVELVRRASTASLSLTTNTNTILQGV